MNFFSAMVWTGCITYNNDDACFGLDQLAYLDLHSASSLKQLSTGRPVALLGQIILIPCQRVFALSSECYLFSREAMNITFIVFGLTRLGLEFTIKCKWVEHANHYTLRWMSRQNFAPTTWCSVHRYKWWKPENTNKLIFGLKKWRNIL
jgi:hypothetical protein